MNVPCPVPLQSPWSPVGYQVVEVAGAGPPVVGLAPDDGNPPAARPALPPSSPMGYTVVVTEKPAAPRTRLAKPTAVRTRSRKLSTPALLWASIGVGVTCVMGFTLLLAVMRASDEAPAQGPIPALFAVKRGPVVNIPDAGFVKLPREVAAEKPAVPAKENGPALAAAAPAFPGLPAAPACDKEACNVNRPDMPPRDRETFGTTVEFVRNPLEAARVAGQERKLTFILHVSGNFEEARFTCNNAEALRVNALSQQQVGQYLDLDFVSAFQKVATFQLINGVQKNGGNVASYFCTPEGRVLHAIAGPVDGGTFLREARWANETFKLAQIGNPPLAEVQAFFRKAHTERLLTEHRIPLPKDGLPRPHAVSAKLLDQLLLQNQDLGLGNQGKIHLLLAVGAMPRLDHTYQAVFERILNEKISTRPVEVAGR